MDVEQLTAKEIGANLKHLRTIKKLSVKEVSGALEISPKTYYHYEHGYREPNLNMLIKMANFFTCSLDDLVSNSVGGKVDSTISFESFKIDEGKSRAPRVGIEELQSRGHAVRALVRTRRTQTTEIVVDLQVRAREEHGTRNQEQR